MPLDHEFRAHAPDATAAMKHWQETRDIAARIGRAGGTGGFVITSYSIHYTKLYDVTHCFTCAVSMSPTIASVAFEGA